jgi:hypothetical protein
MPPFGHCALARQVIMRAATYRPMCAPCALARRSMT